MDEGEKSMPALADRAAFPFLMPPLLGIGPSSVTTSEAFERQ